METRVNSKPEGKNTDDGYWIQWSTHDRSEIWGHLPCYMVGCIYYTSVTLSLCYESCICILCDNEDCMIIMIYGRPMWWL